jgi:hypothetical protein
MQTVKTQRCFNVEIALTCLWLKSVDEFLLKQRRNVNVGNVLQVVRWFNVVFFNGWRKFKEFLLNRRRKCNVEIILKVVQWINVELYMVEKVLTSFCWFNVKIITLKLYFSLYVLVRHALSCAVMSFPVLSYPVLWYPVLSCPVLSHHVLSR